MYSRAGLQASGALQGYATDQAGVPYVKDARQHLLFNTQSNQGIEKIRLQNDR